MVRPALTLLVLLSLGPVAGAAIAPAPAASPLVGKDPSVLRQKALAPGLVRQPAGAPAQRAATPVPPVPGQPTQFVLTNNTEVELDGRPCRYQDVPKNASILLIELADDQKTILKIHFRTKK